MDWRLKVFLFSFFLSLIVIGLFWMLVFEPRIKTFVQYGYLKGLDVCKDKLIGYNVVYAFNLTGYDIANLSNLSNINAT